MIFTRKTGGIVLKAQSIEHEAEVVCFVHRTEGDDRGVMRIYLGFGLSEGLLKDCNNSFNRLYDVISRCSTFVFEPDILFGDITGVFVQSVLNYDIDNNEFYVIGHTYLASQVTIPKYLKAGVLRATDNNEVVFDYSSSMCNTEFEFSSYMDIDLERWNDVINLFVNKQYREAYELAAKYGYDTLNGCGETNWLGLMLDCIRTDKVTVEDAINISHRLGCLYYNRVGEILQLIYKGVD